MQTPTTWPTGGSSPVDEATIDRIDAWWRAANYLSIGQIYLLANPLLRAPLTRDDVKPRLLGHWGTTPGLNFLYAHLNRAIQQRDLLAACFDIRQLRAHPIRQLSQGIRFDAVLACEAANVEQARLRRFQPCRVERQGVCRSGDLVFGVARLDQRAVECSQCFGQ